VAPWPALETVRCEKNGKEGRFIYANIHNWVSFNLDIYHSMRISFMRLSVVCRDFQFVIYHRS